MTENMIQVIKRIETEENTFVLRAAVNEENALLVLYVVSQPDSSYLICKYSPSGEYAGQTAALDSLSRAHEPMDAQMKRWGYPEENPVLRESPSP